MDAKKYFELEGKVDDYSRAVKDFDGWHERAMEDNSVSGNSLYVETIKRSREVFGLYNELISEPELPKAFRTSANEKRQSVLEKVAALEAKRPKRTPVGAL